MDIRVLKYFLMVAREENITKAASLLHVTQPTLSRQLIQLEEELGVKLFIRGKHRIILTDDGMLLKRRAQEIVSLTDKTIREFTDHQGELAGEISIGCGETKNMTFISERMAAFRSMHPLVHFSIYSAIADDIRERIEKGLLDAERFIARSRPEEIFQLSRVEDIEALARTQPVERLHLVATDLATLYMRDCVDTMDDGTFALYLKYHFFLCERRDMIGASHHALDVLRKRA